MMSPVAGQKTSPPKHEAKAFIDPEADRHAWAEALRPDITRPSLPDQKLSQRLIKEVAVYATKLKTEDKKLPFCIVGSRVLQRILTTRFQINSSNLDWETYPVEDTDIWFTDNQALTDFYSHFCAIFKNSHQLKENQLHCYVNGLCIFPVLLFDTGDEMKGDRFRAKLDLVAPLDKAPAGEAWPPLSGDPTFTDVRDYARFRFHRLIHNAQPQPLAVYDDNTIKAPSLTDLGYLTSLNDVLSGELKYPEWQTPRTVNKSTSGDKVKHWFFPCCFIWKRPARS